MRRSIFVIGAFTLMASPLSQAQQLARSQAQQLEGLVVYRGLNGDLTQASRKNFAMLVAEAARRGRITIWLTFDMPFQGNPELRTPEVAAQEAQVRTELIGRVVMPLVTKGEVDVLPHVLTGAPGCQLSVTASGLARLVRNRAVKHIGYLSSRMPKAHSHQ